MIVMDKYVSWIGMVATVAQKNKMSGELKKKIRVCLHSIFNARFSSY